MSNVMANLFVDVQPSNAELTFFVDGNYFLIAKTVCLYVLWQILRSMMVDSMTSSLCNAFYDCRRSRHDITFNGIYAETNRNMSW